LQAQGIAHASVGRGVFVRQYQPARRIASDRYSRELLRATTADEGTLPLETSFTHDHRIGWSDYQLHKTFTEVPADHDLANLFEVPIGEPILERRFVFHAKGLPEQMSTSCLPLRLVRGTPVADPANEPWPGGNIAQLATLGTLVSRVEESVAARMPLPDEVATLRIPSGVPVFTITRRMIAGPHRTVVEVAFITIPADRAILDYAIDLPEPPNPDSVSD
ncbi:MAG: UTRA domain-containing protein, partial [Pseudonocardiaceae bacterium]